MDGIKLDLVETSGEGPVADVSNNSEDTYHRLNRAQIDDKRRETTDQMHRSGKIEGSRGEERVPHTSNGTGGPQEIQHSFANTSTEHLLPNSAVPGDQKGPSASIGKRSQENGIENSSVKKNDKELDGTTSTSEYNHNQEENCENEQYLPKKRGIPGDYELVVPSK